MQALASNVGTIVDGVIGWIGDYVSIIMDTPLLLFFACVPLVGTAIKLLRRLIRL